MTQQKNIRGAEKSKKEKNTTITRKAESCVEGCPSGGGGVGKFLRRKGRRRVADYTGGRGGNNVGSESQVEGGGKKVRMLVRGRSFYISKLGGNV